MSRTNQNSSSESQKGHGGGPAAGKNATEGPNARSKTPTGKSAKTTGNDAGPTSPGAEERVISPELRSLLSRKVEKLDKRTVKERGGGVG